MILSKLALKALKRTKAITLKLKVLNFNRIIGLSLNLNAQELQKRAKGTLIKTAGEPVQRFPDKIDACVRE